MKHTKGPWKVNRIDDDEYKVCFDHGAGLCALASVETVTNIDGDILIDCDEAAENAYLIAAAPCLLSALENLGTTIYTASGCAMNPKVESAMRKAMDAIKKARGE